MSKKIDAVLSKLFLILVASILGLAIVHYIHETFFFEGHQLETPFASSVYYHQTPYTMFTPRPNSVLDMVDAQGKHIITNERGYRGPLPSSEDQGEFRIFILGGSTVFGNKTDIASLTQNILHKKGYTDVRVFNFGVGSSMAGQSLARIVFEVSDYNPDLVIMYSGANDFEHPWYADPRPGYPFNFFVNEANPFHHTQLKDFPFWAMALYRSSILRAYFPDFFSKYLGRKNALRDSVGYGSEEWLQKIVDTYWGFLKKSQMVSHAMGADFMAILQPMLVFKDKFAGNEKEIVKTVYNADVIEKLRTLFRKKIKDDPDLNIEDASDFFDDYSKEEVFTDTVHLHQKYRSHIAKYIADLAQKCPSKFCSQHQQK